MQENRSFDHVFGTLRGVRGFNDPRAITLPDGNPVWVQADAKGQRFVPFRLDIKGTKATWMGSLPHDWADQTDARNHGLYDRWLPAKRSGNREYQDMPLTLGYYTRADVPFYYALADAFTICDQYFCSALSPTTPNRCYLWTGTIRERQNAASPANLRNEDLETHRSGSWPAFPERLEDHGVSWKIYQNEVDVGTGFSEEEDAWLANYGDNPLECFRQYHVQLASNHRAFVERRIQAIPALIAKAKAKQLAVLQSELKRLETEREAFRGKSLDTLTERERILHERAFCTNTGDPHYRQLADVVYRDGNVERRLRAPKGDLFHQFRADVENGRLPTVSWLVGPEAFSDHPSSAWYGAWYIAEALDILTRNPAVWKKDNLSADVRRERRLFRSRATVRRAAARPSRNGSGHGRHRHERRICRAGSGPQAARPAGTLAAARSASVIACRWSSPRPGAAGAASARRCLITRRCCSSWSTFSVASLQRTVAEPNISHWRRVVCGDLTSAFQPAAKTSDATVPFPPRDTFLESIHEAQFKDVPSNFHALQPDEIEAIRHTPSHSPWLPRQEAGTRTSCPLPYELVADGSLNGPRTEFTIRFEARKDRFGTRAAGAPFHRLRARQQVAGDGTKLCGGSRRDAGGFLGTDRIRKRPHPPARVRTQRVLSGIYGRPRRSAYRFSFRWCAGPKRKRRCRDHRHQSRPSPQLHDRNRRPDVREPAGVTPTEAGTDGTPDDRDAQVVRLVRSGLSSGRNERIIPQTLRRPR